MRGSGFSGGLNSTSETDLFLHLQADSITKFDTTGEPF